MILGDRLKELRTEKGLTTRELSRLIGIGQSTISNYENGIREPNVDMIKLFANFYSVSTDYIMGKVDKKNNTNPVEDFPDDVKIMMRDCKELTPEQKKIIHGIIMEFKERHSK